MNNKKVMVGLSGGIDSAMTALLLQKEGYDIQAVYMKLHNKIKGYHEKNILAGEKISEFLGIKYHILDLTEEFDKNVYNYFVQSYQDGITPNPCVMCNKTIKFGKLFDFAMQKGCDYLATGHYASSDLEYIYTASDLTKDQSYFLAQIDKTIIPKLIFPMSKYSKEYILKEATKIPQFQQIIAQKESQEICFVENDYTDILREHTNIDNQGDTLDEDGNIIGHHKGFMNYTIGKRRGFYVHGAHEPHFVKSIDAKNNTITVTKKNRLAIDTVYINNLNMFIDEIDFTCSVKLRYRSKAIDCDVKIDKDNNSAKIILKENAFGVASGQIAVFYNKNRLIGSGVILQSQ